MKVAQMIPSTYLKKEDIEGPTILTIDRMEQSNVAMQGQPEEMKWCLFFTELEKGMVLNSTNIHLLAQACGSDESDDWPGKEVVIYVDPNVSFGGKVVGGLRVRPMDAPPARPPTRASKPARPTAPPSTEEEDPDPRYRDQPKNANYGYGDDDAPPF